ncbi:MAG: hypothetical protein IPL72_07700 [Sulfuritalea sp.]|nr:hypothetical protein [Sulfuritalea sp.]
MDRMAGALMDAQVDLNPHQIDAALFATSNPLAKGAILADEVGLGKTIEAGLLIAQCWAERKGDLDSFRAQSAKPRMPPASMPLKSRIQLICKTLAHGRSRPASNTPDGFRCCRNSFPVPTKPGFYNHVSEFLQRPVSLRAAE